MPERRILERTLWVCTAAKKVPPNFKLLLFAENKNVGNEFFHYLQSHGSKGGNVCQCFKKQNSTTIVAFRRIQIDLILLLVWYLLL